MSTPQANKNQKAPSAASSCNGESDVDWDEAQSVESEIELVIKPLPHVIRQVLLLLINKKYLLSLSIFLYLPGTFVKSNSLYQNCSGCYH